MNNELCSSCGGKLDPQKNEILTHVGIAIILAREPRQSVEIENRAYHICETCGLAGKVPNLDGALFSEILKAKQGN